MEYAFHELWRKDKVPSAAAVIVAADLSETGGYGQRDYKASSERRRSLVREGFVEIDGGEGAKKPSHIAFSVDQHVAGKAVAQEDRSLHADDKPCDAADVNVELVPALHSRHFYHPGYEGAGRDAKNLKEKIRGHGLLSSYV